MTIDSKSPDENIEINLFKCNVNEYLKDAGKAYNLNHRDVLARFLVLQEIKEPGNIALITRDIRSLPPLRVGNHNGDINLLFDAVKKVCNFAERVDEIITRHLKEHKKFKDITKYCIREFLGIVWMGATGYYEPMRCMRNSIAHDRYEYFKGDNQQTKILFYDIKDEVQVTWKLSCDRNAIRDSFIKFLELSMHLFE